MSNIKRIKQKELYNEICLSLGGRLGFNFRITNKLQLYGTGGLGYMISSLKYDAYSKYKIGGINAQLSLKSNSLPAIAPFCISTFGSEYRLKKRVVLGMEYQMKYRIPEFYTSKQVTNYQFIRFKGFSFTKTKHNIDTNFGKKMENNIGVINQKTNLGVNPRKIQHYVFGTMKFLF